MISGQYHFLQSLGWAVINSLWQMAFLWVIFQLITQFFYSRKSNSKNLLATCFLISGFTWFIYTFLNELLNTRDSAILSSLIINPIENKTFSTWLENILPVISMLYLLILALPVWQLIKSYRYAQVLRHYGLTKIDAAWKVFVKNTSYHLGIKKPVQIWISEFISSPVTIGFLKPVILIPVAALNNLTLQQLEAVILHELTHIKRYDYLLNLIISFIKAILYFNPFVKAFALIIERERESSCDKMVLQYQYNPVDYAAALITLEKINRTSNIFLLPAIGKNNDLLQRIKEIVGIRKKQSFSINKAAGILAGLFLIVSLNLLLLASGFKQQELNPDSEFTSPIRFSVIATGGIPSNIKNTIIKQTEPQRKVAVQKNKKRNSIEEKATVSNIVFDDNAEVLAVSYKPIEIPELTYHQENQIKKTIDASKTILENTQWKELEKNIADVYNQKQKEEIKALNKSAFDNYDWGKLEKYLKLKYTKIDWERVKYLFSDANRMIQLDSLQRVYNQLNIELADLQNELITHHQNSIPDTDITLKTLQDKKQLISNILDKIKAIRSKKIIKL